MAPTHGNFSVNWKLNWKKFGDLSANPLKKYFTPFENVVYFWRSEIRQSTTDNTKIEFRLFYDDGPLEELKNVSYNVEILKSDNKWKNIITATPFDAKRGQPKEFPNFDDMDKTAFQAKHGLQNATWFIYHVTVKIPLDAFAYKMELPSIDLRPLWLSDLFNHVDQENSEKSDVRLVTGDEKKFYAHELVLARQSIGLSTLFKNAESPDEKAGIFRFPKLRAESMRSILQFFYTGETPLDSMETGFIIEIADFAEQFQIKTLKKIAAVSLWKRAVEKPEDCMEILLFTHLHDDLNYLKHRAMGVLVENTDCMALHMADFWEKNQYAFGLANRDGDNAYPALRGKELRDEYNLFVERQLEVWF